ncbi:hypothetical protein [Bacillus cereus]|uniref:hypothetical protein n=1 Tax=Bacillus cereus TaxID=1396 RepID=UPI001155A349|nr:hypothetical protein [Bacillus cereus]
MEVKAYGYYSPSNELYEVTYEKALTMRKLKKRILYKLIKVGDNPYFHNNELQDDNTSNGFVTLFYKNKIY